MFCSCWVLNWSPYHYLSQFTSNLSPNVPTSITGGHSGRCLVSSGRISLFASSFEANELASWSASVLYSCIEFSQKFAKSVKSSYFWIFKKSNRSLYITKYKAWRKFTDYKDNKMKRLCQHNISTVYYV